MSRDRLPSWRETPARQAGVPGLAGLGPAPGLRPPAPGDGLPADAGTARLAGRQRVLLLGLFRRSIHTPIGQHPILAAGSTDGAEHNWTTIDLAAHWSTIYPLVP